MNKKERRHLVRVIDKAVDSVLQNGLYKGWYSGPNDSMCILGHLNYVETGYCLGMSGDKAYGYFTVMGPEETVNDTSNISSWNDRDDTNSDDVMSLLLSEAEALDY